MRHRIFIDALEPVVTVAGDEFHHSVRVVRIREGEEVELFDRSGKMARAVVETLGRDSATIRVVEPLASRESALAIHLAMAVIQLEKFELVLQKATELGVRSIVPLVTERVELRPERYSGKAERWNRIIFEAVKQSGRSAVPELAPPARFDDVVSGGGVRILFDADADPDPLAGNPSEVTILIGPEGGWSDDELRLARQRGCRFERLGPRRLRAETAAIAAVAVMASRFGDL